MAGGDGRVLPVKSMVDPCSALPALMSGEPAAGVKSVPAAVNIGSTPAMDAESNPYAVASLCHDASEPLPFTHS